MQLHPVALRLNYDDYVSLPNDGRRYELIEGELEVNPSPAPRHQTVSRRLQYALMRVLEEPGLAQVFNAPLDVILSPSDVVQPDLVVVRNERESIITERGVEGPPDIVVEILSPSTSVLDRRVKKRTYARFAVPEYWIVDPVGGHLELYSLVEPSGRTPAEADEGYRLTYRFDRAARLITPSFAIVDIELGRVFR